jgi:hypothetical protein
MNMARYLYSELARRVQARRNCAQKLEKLNPNAVSATVEMKDNEWHQTFQWQDKHTETIQMLVKAHMPSGSGFDSGTKIDLERSHADKLVFTTAFHHMNENGYYDGRTEHTVTVTPSLADEFNIRISGRNRNDIKQVIYDSFDWELRRDVTYDLYLDQFPELAIQTKWEDENGQPSESQIAYYVEGKRFHSSDKSDGGIGYASPLDRARAYAGQEMYRRFITPKSA